jgi:hypothetical protein
MFDDSGSKLDLAQRCCVAPAAEVCSVPAADATIQTEEHRRATAGADMPIKCSCGCRSCIKTGTTRVSARAHTSASARSGSDSVAAADMRARLDVREGMQLGGWEEGL